jgi:hypothetical protein
VSAEKLYSRIELRPGAELRVIRVPWNGRNLYHIREYFEREGRMVPGRGIAIKPEHIERVALALQLILDELADA